MSEIGDRLRRIRRELNLQQGAFSEKIGLKQGSYSDIENGKKTLLYKYIRLICLEFGVDMEWLQNGGDRPVFITTELTHEEKQLLDVYDKLLPETRKMIRDIINEKLELQELRNKQENDQTHDT